MPCVPENSHVEVGEACLSAFTPLCYFYYYSDFVLSHAWCSLAVLEYFSPMCGSVTDCMFIQLLEHKVRSVAWLGLDQSFMSLNHRRHVAGLCMMYNINSSLYNCLLAEKFKFELDQSVSRQHS